MHDETTIDFHLKHNEWNHSFTLLQFSRIFIETTHSDFHGLPLQTKITKILVVGL